MRRVALALREASREWRRATTPQPPIPGVRRPFLVDEPLWESMEPDDVRYALLHSWREYVATWDGVFRKKAAPPAAADADAVAGAPPTAGGTGAAAADAATDPPAALAAATSDALRQAAGRAAAQASAAVSDPNARAKVAELTTQALVGAHAVVDSFLIGYYDGQATELAKEKGKEAESTSSRLFSALDEAYAAAAGGARQRPPSPVAGTGSDTAASAAPAPPPAPPTSTSGSA